MVGRLVARLALSADRCLRKIAEDSREAQLVRELVGMGEHVGQLSRKKAADESWKSMQSDVASVKPTG